MLFAPHATVFCASVSAVDLSRPWLAEVLPFSAYNSPQLLEPPLRTRAALRVVLLWKAAPLPTYAACLQRQRNLSLKGSSIEKISQRKAVLSIHPFGNPHQFSHLVRPGYGNYRVCLDPTLASDSEATFVREESVGPSNLRCPSPARRHWRTA